MIIDVFNKCCYIIYEKYLNVIICEKMFLFSISLQIQLSIYADKNHMLVISDNFSYECNLSFLHKSQAVQCLGFKSLDGINSLTCDLHEKCNLIQQQSVLTIGMRNLFTVPFMSFTSAQV